MTDQPPAANARPVSRAEAHRLWLGALQRQGLAGGSKHRSLYGLSQQSLGLHAARLPSPFATALARVDTPSVADRVFSTGSERLVTVRCMRKTLHMLPEQLAGIAHTATRHYRERDARRLALNAGVSAGRLDQLVTLVTRLLAESTSLTHREIEAALSDNAPRVTPLAARAALKFAWESGRVVYRNASSHWNRESRRFALARSITSHIVDNSDQPHAATALITLYFERYGPATIKDAMWWSGLSRTSVERALNTADRDVARLRTSWCADDLYFFADTFDDATTAGRSSAVDFLAHEDVALKAYHQSRPRYLGSLPQKAVFNQIGEVLPAIMSNGRIAGTWHWDARNRSVGWRLFRDSAVTAKKCTRRADELTAALRSRYDG